MDHFPSPSSVLLPSLLSEAVVASFYSQWYLQSFLSLSICAPISIPPQRSRRQWLSKRHYTPQGCPTSANLMLPAGCQSGLLTPVKLRLWLWRDDCCFNQEKVCNPEAPNNSTLRMSRPSVDQSGRAPLQIPSESNIDDVCF